MRVIRTTSHDDFSVAVNSAMAAEQLGLGWVIMRGERCPMVEKYQETGEEPTEVEQDSHCPVHDHLPEYVVMLIEENIPAGVLEPLHDAVEMILATDERVRHEGVTIPDDVDLNDPPDDLPG